MKIAIMQPYFFPYIGYFHLINAVDEFVIYDNIEFTKKGWINRNRILVNGTNAFISLPLKKDSDYRHVKDRFLAETWDVDRKKMLNRITESYRKAPYFQETYDVLEKCIMYDNRNLFNFILFSVQTLIRHLNIETKLTISSSIPIDHQMKSEEKVIAICKQQGANIYINAFGGQELYNKDVFNKEKLNLNFIKSGEIEYKQFNNAFKSFLSIIDVMMFNSREEINIYLNNYTIL